MRQKKKHGFGSMSLLAHQFGHVEFRIFDVVFFRKVHLKKSKQIFNIINSKFDTSKSMSGQGHPYACKFLENINSFPFPVVPKICQTVVVISMTSQFP